MGIKIEEGDVVCCSVRGTVNNQKCQTDFYVRVTEVPVANSWTAFGIEVRNYFEANFFDPLLPYISNTVVDLDLILQNVLPTRYRAQEFTPDTREGTAMGELLPPHDAVLLSRFAAESGRSRQARNYLFGMVETIQNAGEITDDIFLLMEAALETAFVGVKTGTLYSWEFGVQTWHPGAAPGDPPVPNLFKPVDIGRLDKILRTQRRRMIGRGN